MSTESQPTGADTPIPCNRAEVVTIRYTNHRGETAVRRILPERLWFGSTAWHAEPQWLMDAWDFDKQAVRSFAMRNVREWTV